MPDVIIKKIKTIRFLMRINYQHIHVIHSHTEANGLPEDLVLSLIQMDSLSIKVILFLIQTIRLSDRLN